MSDIETFSSFVCNLPRTMLIVAHLSNPQKSPMSSNILFAVLVISSAFCADLLLLLLLLLLLSSSSLLLLLFIYLFIFPEVEALHDPFFDRTVKLRTV